MTIFTIARRARAARALVLDLGPRPRAHDVRRRGRSPQRELDEHFAPLRARRLRRLRRLARRRRRVRDRMADRLPAVGARRLQAEGLPGAGLRARLLRRVGASACGRRRPTGWATLRGGQPVAERGAARALRRRAPRPSSWASTSTLYRRARRCPPRRHGRLLRAPVDPAPRDRARPAGARASWSAAGPGCGSCCSATRSRPAGPVPARVRRGARRRRRSRASTTRRPSGW